MSKVLIIGGGAAGMMAAAFAAKNGNRVEVFEKNEKLGKKLFITGKGRCNITKRCGSGGFLSCRDQQSEIPLQCVLQLYQRTGHFVF